MQMKMKLAATFVALPLALATAGLARAQEAPAALVQKAVDNLPKVPVKAKLKLTPPQGEPRIVELAHSV